MMFWIFHEHYDNYSERTPNYVKVESDIELQCYIRGFIATKSTAQMSQIVGKSGYLYYFSEVDISFPVHSHF